MFSFKTYYLKVLFNISVFLSVIVLFFYAFSIIDNIKFKYSITLNDSLRNTGYIYKKLDSSLVKHNIKIIKNDDDYNVWLIFAKVIDKSPLMYNFNNLIINLVNISSVPLHFNVIVDNTSELIARKIFEEVYDATNIVINFTFYDVQICARLIEDIVDVMTPHFSSRPGTYYSDALFYISLGLYRIAPKKQKIAVMLDCDLYFKEDILLLFNEFKYFEDNILFGLAPELTPVYRHVLYMYKLKHNTTFGEYYHSNNIASGTHPRGFQGYNSGVVLLNLSAIRKSKEFVKFLSNDSVNSMANKYRFRGHLGDQDYYTLLGFEQSHVIRTLNCGFNRQLCVWWRDHGYKDIFNNYYKCNDRVVILHGNCNTKIPK